MGAFTMKPCCFVVLLSAVLLLTSTELWAQKIKVIVDQDARGPATTDMQSILIFLQSDKFDVLGITTVSGDQWVKEETQRTLRLLEIAGRTDVPVAQGAEFPLLNSKPCSADNDCGNPAPDRPGDSQAVDLEHLTGLAIPREGHRRHRGRIH